MSSAADGLALRDLQNNTPQLVNEPPFAQTTQHQAHNNLQQWLTDLSPYNRFNAMQ